MYYQSSKFYACFNTLRTSYEIFNAENIRDVPTPEKLPFLCHEYGCFPYRYNSRNM
jgi:hypothetical protein